jgi:hypothetical protein
MTEHEASRTLVKSAPELWAECSDAGSLGRHLDKFGEIRITRREPETTVAWEGEDVSGTVRLEPSGWGTRVILTAQRDPAEPAPEPTPDPQPEPAPEPELPPEPESLPPAAQASETPVRRGKFSRWLNRFLSPPPATAGDGEPPDEDPELQGSDPQPVAASEAPDQHLEFPEALAALTAALDSLGQAHHRPFSRA